MNTFEIIGLKKKIDDALVRIADKVSEYISPTRTMICYQGQFKYPAFAIFKSIKNQDAHIHKDGVSFFADKSIDIGLVDEIIEEILAEMQKDIG